MLQKTFLDVLRDIARGTKVEVTRKRPRDMNATALAQRGMDAVALVTINRGGREEILQVADLCAGGFDADQIGLIFEAYEVAANPQWPDLANTNPLTGQPWQRGEINDLVDNHGAIAKGWATETVQLTAANRAGDVASMSMPFRYAGTHLVWEAEKSWTSLEEGKEIRGAMIDVLMQVMAKPSVTQIMTGIGVPGTPERSKLDAIAAEVLTEKGHAVLLFGDDEQKINRIRRFGR